MAVKWMPLRLRTNISLSIGCGCPLDRVGFCISVAGRRAEGGRSALLLLLQVPGIQ